MSEPLLENKNVLVAEDDAINQLVVKHTLSKLGAKVTVVGNGADAVKYCKDNDCDLVLMDVQMPVMDGYEATEKLRNEANINVPIIAMTAFALKGEEEKCLAMGMNGYVSKPFTTDSLSTAIKKVLQSAPAENSNAHLIQKDDVIIDISMLYDISGNDEGFVRMMVQTFLETFPVTVNTLEKSIDELDWNGIYKTAHHAKSSLSVIKVNELFDWIFEIETNGRNKSDLPGIKHTFSKIKQRHQAAHKLLAQTFEV